MKGLISGVEYSLSWGNIFCVRPEESETAFLIAFVNELHFLVNYTLVIIIHSKICLSYLFISNTYLWVLECVTWFFLFCQNRSSN
jgi:hypothetical protein